ncbi:MAG: hypothetical protein ACRDYE_01245 [Acidimicrobiales bacterium]
MPTGESGGPTGEAGGPTGGEGADAEQLRHTVDELRKENETLRESEGRPRHRGRLWKRIGSWVLLVLACILAVVSVLVVFVRNEVLDSDAYVSTVAPLASDPAIQTAVATRVSRRLVNETDLQQRVKSALPSRAGFLAGPITSGVESATDQITLKVVQSGRFQTFWVNANRKVHEQVVALLTGSTAGALQSNNGEVTLDLSQVETQAKQALDAHGITVFNNVPSVKGPTLVLFRSTQLTKLQRLIRFLDHLALVLPILALLCFAGAVLLTRNRRRGLVRVAAGLALSMALVLVVAAVARNQYLSSLQANQSKPAAAAVFDAISALLLDSVRTILIIAALVAVGALIAGNRWVRSWSARRKWPRWVTEGPVHEFAVRHRKGLQWAVLGLGLLVIVVWSNPTTLVVVVIVLVSLAVVGLLGLVAARRQPALAAAGPGPPGGEAAKDGEPESQG